MFFSFFFDVFSPSLSKKELRIDYWTGAFLMAAFGYLAFSGILVFLYYQQWAH